MFFGDFSSNVRVFVILRIFFSVLVFGVERIFFWLSWSCRIYYFFIICLALIRTWIFVGRDFVFFVIEVFLVFRIMFGIE